MKTHSNLMPGLILALLAFVTSGMVARAQTHSPTNWVNNPFNPNPNFGVVHAGTSSPTYTNNGYYLGTLYGDSPIGATLTLENPGDTISFFGESTLNGVVNPDGNMQFRVGLYYRDGNEADTNWLGYMIGNPVNVGADAPTGLFVRNNPNPGIYGSGSPGNAMRPRARDQSYQPGWTAGTYDFSLSVSRISDEAQVVSWKLAARAPGTFSYTGSFTNTFETTTPDTFDHVGFLAGAALFSSASTSTSIAFSNLTVNLTTSAASE